MLDTQLIADADPEGLLRRRTPPSRRHCASGTGLEGFFLGLTSPLKCGKDNACVGERPRALSAEAPAGALTHTIRRHNMTEPTTPFSPQEVAARLNDLHKGLPATRNALTDAVDEVIVALRAQRNPSKAYDEVFDALPPEARREFAHTLCVRVTVRDRLNDRAR